MFDLPSELWGALPMLDTRRVVVAATLAGAVIAAAGGRIALFAVVLFAAGDHLHLISQSEAVAMAARSAAVLLGAIGLLQVFVNLVVGRDAGGGVLWSILALTVALVLRPGRRGRASDTEDAS
ncbi:MAG: hypothetical protein ACU0CI_06350 [Shimia sp.]